MLNAHSADKHKLYADYYQCKAFVVCRSMQLLAKLTYSDVIWKVA